MADEDLLERQRRLNDKDSAMINSEMQNNRKSGFLAYLLWFFLGALGVHKFYLNESGWGALLCACTLGGWLFVSTLPLASSVMWIIVIVTLLCDLFCIPEQIARRTRRLRKKLLEQCENNPEAF